MAFRWKNFPTPEQNKAAYLAEQDMEGFVPNSSGYATAYNVDPGLMATQNMQGYNPNNVYNARTPVVAGGDGAGYRFDSAGIDAYMADQQKRTQIQARIAELENELASVTNRIAEIDKATPSLSKNPREWEIAAKRAEIGDMSAYDNLVSRGNTDATAATGIENELYNAEKLTWGLNSKSDEDRAIARSNIEASLRRAEEWARKSGKELPDSYYRLRAALEGAPEGGSADMNAREYGNEIALKIYRGTATDEDIEKGVAWAEKNPNSDAAKEILEAAKSGKYSTVEAKARAARAKKEATDKIEELQRLPVKEQEQAWMGLDEKFRKNILKYATWDTTGNRGLIWRK